jgi:hypothetical protein
MNDTPRVRGGESIRLEIERMNSFEEDHELPV